jgi:hypothetical protein
MTLTVVIEPKPKWTVVHRHVLVDTRWSSVAYEFFDDKLIADKYYAKYEKEGTAIVIRPYSDSNDNKFLHSARTGELNEFLQNRRNS